MTTRTKRCHCGRFTRLDLCARCDAREQRIFIAYPFVVEAGNDPAIGSLRLPKNLRQHEADRAKQMIDALVIA